MGRIARKVPLAIKWDGKNNHLFSDFKDGDEEGWQMYQTATMPSSPISPVFKTQEELAQWLVDNKKSGGGEDANTYDEWLATIKEENGVSSFVVGHTADSKQIMMSGVRWAGLKAKQEQQKTKNNGRDPVGEPRRYLNE